jgi:acetyl-CoA carboxylase carboxyl transferase subunit beta
VLCGIGERDGQPIAYVAQTGAADTPAGFRTARRTLTLAERLGIGLLTLIDTPGADTGPASERAGLGTAVAELFAAMARAKVPVTTAVIGEGGSGGALALAGPGPMYMTPDSYFAVIAPELAAAILLRDRGKAKEVAPLMRLSAEELEEDDIARAM